MYKVRELVRTPVLPHRKGVIEIRLMQTNRLGEGDKERLRILARESGVRRELYLDGGLNADKDLDSFYLVWEDDRIASALVIFAPTRREAEVTVFTHPDFRRRGYFNCLLYLAIAELVLHDVESLLFVLEGRWGIGRMLAERKGALLERSEHVLVFRGGLPAARGGGLALLPLSEEWIPSLARIQAAAFSVSVEEAESRTLDFFAAKEIEAYIATLGDVPVGGLSVNRAGNERYICGVVVDPAKQGKGYGRGMLRLLLEKLLLEDSAKEIVIEVDNENHRALNLYLSMGFVEAARCDYMRLSLKQ